MPTSSKGRNIIISDNKSAEQFISALETASKNPRKPSKMNTRTLKRGEIAEVFGVKK